MSAQRENQEKNEDPTIIIGAGLAGLSVLSGQKAAAGILEEATE